MFLAKLITRPVLSRLGILLFSLFIPTVWAADLSNYRGFKFGTTVAAVVTTGEGFGEVKVIHKEPALVQEMEWRLRTPGPASKPDSVRDGVLSFLNDRLYRIVITYDRYQVEGMTADDMIEGISQSYGIAARPAVEIPYVSNYGTTASVIARWEDSAYSYDLVRTGDKASYAMVLYSKSLTPLAQAAIAEGVRLDGLSAPQRAKDEAQKRLEEERIALEKSRTANKPNFKP